MIRRIFRFMALVSSNGERFGSLAYDAWARRHARPQQVESGFNTGMQGGVPVERPNEKRAEDGLPEDVGNLLGGKVIPNLPLFLPEPDELGVQPLHAFLQIKQGLAHGSAREISLKKRTNDFRVARWFLGHADTQGAQELRHGFVAAARLFNSGFKLPELHFAKSQEDMVFAREVIEKSALADIGSFRNVLNRAFREAFLGEHGKRRAEEALADLGTTALAPVGRCGDALIAWMAGFASGGHA